MTKESRPFTKREWIQLIITLTLIQAFFWYVVFENSQSASALGYVSFAGTLVSIILAVLAIGYTYGESISQKNKGNELANQITTLGTLIEHVEIEARSLEKIQDIAKELTSFIGVYGKDKQESTDYLAKIQSNISNLTMTRGNVSEDIGPQYKWKVDKILNRRSPLDEACLLMIKLIERDQIGSGINAMAGILQDTLKETPMSLNNEFFYGAIYTQYSLLVNLGLIEEDEDSSWFKLSDDLSDFIMNHMINIEKEKEKINGKVNKGIKNTYSKLLCELYSALTIELEVS